MSRKRLVLREVARRDFEDAVDFYKESANEVVALRLVEALRRTLRSIGNKSGRGISEVRS